MQTLRAFFLLLFLGIISEISYAQSLAGFQSLMYPHSIASSGLGEQGVASRNVFGAMQYNPANLIYADELDFSFFRNPWKIIGWTSVPLTSVQAAVNLGNSGSAGIEYTNWDFGEFATTGPDSPDIIGHYFAYERSIAGGYAISISNCLAVGAQIRYVWQSFSPQTSANQILFSAGLLYRPEKFSDRLNIGLSFMNFGTRIEYNSIEPARNVNVIESDPPPAQINLGIEGLPVHNDFCDLSLALSAVKPISKWNSAPEYWAQSSFKSLFDDWSNFPADVTVKAGLGFTWHPIYLGAGISFFQEIYLGYFSTGAKDNYNSFYTHGVKIGLDVCGVRAAAGYAGRWHNNNAGEYLTYVFPWESFQLDISTDISMFGEGREYSQSETSPKKIILAAGYNYGLAVGRMKETTINNIVTESLSMKHGWSAEGDFYISDNSAIISSLHYSRMTGKIIIYLITPWEHTVGIETASFESGFRYHPINAFKEFFVQASIGVLWMNYVHENSTPKYSYTAVDEIAVGFVFPLSDLHIVVIPKAGLRTIFEEIGTIGSRLGGYNQFEFGLSVGYEI
jgi:hypothetical protein